MTVTVEAKVLRWTDAESTRRLREEGKEPNRMGRKRSPREPDLADDRATQNVAEPGSPREPAPCFATAHRSARKRINVAGRNRGNRLDADRRERDRGGAPKDQDRAGQREAAPACRAQRHQQKTEKQ